MFGKYAAEHVFSARVSGKGVAFGGLPGKLRKGVPQWNESVERIPDARVKEEEKAGCRQVAAFPALRRNA